ncbi:MAG: hypothetical protein HC840_22135 [Leptolyngbyaceae cyanobacterium RM2_2_4]|nr:hypothetical protein [Leptolyngbyaceae cyanobacterium SM1_4_3]NJO51668.1 hypothetical protein [Leptolyngbyaceae cyanobacterium RM2_2_4]
MTPTLFGRWQSRLLLLATVGLLVTLPFSMGWIVPGSYPVFLGVLGYVAAFGLGWDLLYDYLQKIRWDRDWPAAFQLLAGIWEAGFILLLFRTVGLPGVARTTPIGWFALHYSLVWLAVFTVSQTLLRVVFLRSRFRGGQWL